MRRYRDTAIGTAIVLVYLFPVYWMVATSLKPFRDLFRVPPDLVPSPPIVTAYADAVIDNEDVLQAIGNSLIVGAGTLVLTLLLATPAAYALARLRLRFTALVVLLLLLTQMLPTILLAGPLFVSFSQIGLADSRLGLIIADTAVIALPFAIIILRPFFLAIPGELAEAAATDGCTRFGAFRRVVLPLVRPGLITVGAFSFLFAWGEFVFGLTLITDDANQPVTVALSRSIGQFGTRWNDLMAISTAIALPIVIVFAALQRHIVGGLTVGATKG